MKKLKLILSIILISLLIIKILTSVSFASVDLTNFTETNFSSQLDFLNSINNVYFNENIEDIEFSTNIDNYNSLRFELLDLISNNYSVWVNGYYNYNGNFSYGKGVRYEFSTDKDFNSGTLYQFSIYINNANGNFIISKSTFTGRNTSVIGNLPIPARWS